MTTSVYSSYRRVTSPGSSTLSQVPDGANGLKDSTSFQSKGGVGTLSTSSVIFDMPKEAVAGLLPRSTGASLHGFPPEVLGEIFTWCLPERCRPTATCAPLLLCQISSTCRQISLKTPHLWSNLYITSEDFSCCRSSDRESLSSVALQWLSRAGTHLPLSLYFEFINEECVRNVLVPFAHRCKNLRIDDWMPESSWRHLSIETSTAGINQLESLTVSLYYGSHATNIFEVVPRLRRVVLEYCTENPVVTIRLPWSQLTHLTVARFLSPLAWAKLMKQCTKLQKGVFSVNGRCNADMQPPGLGDITTLNDLYDLSILLVEGRASYFRGFRFPSLTSLRLRSRNSGSDFIWDESEHLLGHMRGLRRLSLLGITARIQDLLHILQWPTLLEEFDLDDYVDYTPLLRFLHYETSQDLFLPIITKISLCMQDAEAIDAFSAHDLVRMVDSRLSTSSPLSNVTLHFPESCIEAVGDIREIFSLFPHLPIHLEAAPNLKL